VTECSHTDEPETRDVWWVELRTEIRSHMRAMGCHAVLGYSEQTSIRDELIILSAVGTAALIDMSCTLGTPPTLHQRQLSGTAAQPSTDDDVTHHQHQVQQHKLHVDVALANEVAFNGPHVEQTRYSTGAWFGFAASNSALNAFSDSSSLTSNGKHS